MHKNKADNHTPNSKSPQFLFKNSKEQFEKEKQALTSLNLIIFGCLKDRWLIISLWTFSSIWYHKHSSQRNTQIRKILDKTISKENLCQPFKLNNTLLAENEVSYLILIERTTKIVLYFMNSEAKIHHSWALGTKCYPDSKDSQNFDKSGKRHHEHYSIQFFFTWN